MTATLEHPPTGSPAGPAPARLPLRRDRTVLAWIAASTLSGAGDAALTVALAWTAVSVLPASLAGLVVGLETLPQAALMLVGGVVADRWSTRRVLVLGSLGRSAVLGAAALAWTCGGGATATLVLTAVGFGVCAGLTDPAAATMIRQLVARDDLVVVGGWTQTAARLARLVGAPLGAALVAATGPVTVMLADAATFAAVVVALTTVVVPRYPLPRSVPTAWIRALGDGWRYLRGAPSARWLTLGIAGLNVFVTPVTGIGVALAVRHGSWGAGWVGVADAVLAVAAAVGSVAGTWLARRRAPGRLATRSFAVLVVQGSGLALIGVPSLVALVGGSAVVGLTAGVASVWMGGVWQRRVEPSQLGRTSALSRLGDLTLTPATLPLFGALAAGCGVSTATVASGAAMALLCLWFGTRPAIRALS